MKNQTCSDEPVLLEVSCCLYISLFSCYIFLYFWFPLLFPPTFLYSHLPPLLSSILSDATGNLLVNPLEPGNADKLLVKIADLGNACWVVGANIHKRSILFFPQRIHSYYIHEPCMCFKFCPIYNIINCKTTSSQAVFVFLLLAAQTLHRRHPDPAVSFSGGADRSRLQHTSRHLEHSLHGKNTLGPPAGPLTLERQTEVTFWVK